MSDEMNEEQIEQLREQAHAAGQDGEPVKDEGGATHDYDIPIPGGDPAVEGESIQAITAFVIFQDVNGVCIATADMEHINKLQLRRQATLDDIYRGAAEVAKDVQVMQTSGATVEQQMQMSQRIAQARMNQQMAQQAGVSGQGKGPGGLHVPPGR